MVRFLDVVITVGVFAAAGALVGFVVGVLLLDWMAGDSEPAIFRGLDRAQWVAVVGGLAGACLGVRCALNYSRLRGGLVDCPTRRRS
jgi:hypothetical protein